VVAVSLAATGGGKLVAVVCVDSNGDYLSPCGRCRQLLFEHGGNEMLFMTLDGPKPLSYLLPWAFGPENLK
jgi:cytidine deaminase